MAFDLNGDMVGSILRSGGNSFAVSKMGTPPAARPARESDNASKDSGEPLRKTQAPKAQNDQARRAARDAAADKPLNRRRVTTTVTVDSDTAKWIREERVRRRIQGDGEPWSCSAILGQALELSLSIADKGGKIEEFSCGGGTSDFERLCLNIDLATWLHMEEIIDRYRSEGASPDQIRLSCFVRKGLDIMRNR